MNKHKKEDYLLVLRRMLPMSCVLLVTCFLIGWVPFFLGMQKYWYWALLSSLSGPMIALPLNFSSRLWWLRQLRAIEERKKINLLLIQGGKR